MIKLRTFGIALAVSKVRKIANNMQGAMDDAVLQEAHFLRGHVLEGIRTQGVSTGTPWEPLKESTLEGRREAGHRGSKALIATGSLFASIGVVSDGPGRAFVGVHRTARGKQGESLVDIAVVHEFGTTIVQTVTAKQVAFFTARNLANGRGPTSLQVGDKIIIRIPARPFIRPVLNKFVNTSEERMTRRIADALRNRVS